MVHISSWDNIYSISMKYFGLRKISAQWLPHLLTKKTPNTVRVDKCRKLLKFYKQMQKRRLSDVVTGDETWTHYFEPQRIVDNKMWLTKKANAPLKQNVRFIRIFFLK